MPTADELEERETTGAVAEFGGAGLGDARPTARLVQWAVTLGARPSASLPDACGDGAALKAADRFFENAAVEPAAVLAPHLAATVARVATEPVVLAVQDTTEVDFRQHPATTGLGARGDTAHQGVFVQSTVAFTPARLPLGLLAQQVWRRDPATLGQQPDHKRRPIAAKESQQWLTSLAALSAVAAQCPDPHLVSVGDREADRSDRFLESRPATGALLVRAVQNRRVAAEAGALWAAVAGAPVAATVAVAVPRQPGRPARTATGAGRWAALTLRPATHRATERRAAVPVWVVWARAEHPPSGAGPLDWRLLTTCPVHTAAAARARLAWSACRWGIAVWHKVLKSGGRIAARQRADAAHLRRRRARSRVIAWRIRSATLLGRVAAEAPGTVLLEPDAWQARSGRLQRLPIPPPNPAPRHQAIRWIAHRGGFPARRREGEPGPTVLWRGLQQLADLTARYRIMKPPSPTPLVGQG